MRFILSIALLTFSISANAQVGGGISLGGGAGSCPDSLTYSQDTIKLYCGGAPIAAYVPTPTTLYTGNGSVTTRTVTVGNEILFDGPGNFNLTSSDNFGPGPWNLAGGWYTDGTWLVVCGVNDIDGNPVADGNCKAVNLGTGESLSVGLAPDFLTGGITYSNPGTAELYVASASATQASLVANVSGTEQAFLRVVNDLDDPAGRASGVVFARDTLTVLSARINVSAGTDYRLSAGAYNIAATGNINYTTSGDLVVTAAGHRENLPAYADDADAGANGLTNPDWYQTDGTGAAPLNVPGLVLIKQ